MLTFAFIIICYTSEILMKAFGLLGVEVQGTTFSEHVDNKEVYLDDKFLCSFNLSEIVPDYLIILATIFNIIKWM